MSISPETFSNNWIVKDFYHLAKFLAWEAHCQGEYSKLISAKIAK